MKYINSSILALLAVIIAVCLQGCVGPEADKGVAYVKQEGTTLVISSKPGSGKVDIDSTTFDEWRSNITKVIIEDDIAPIHTNFWFHGMSNLTTIEGLEKLDMSHVTGMDGMFEGCRSLQTLDGISAWDTSSVIQMSNVFNGCKSLTVLDLSGWDVSNVESISHMFALSGLTEVKGMESWDVAKVRTAVGLFSGCTNLQSVGDLNQWEFAEGYMTYNAFYNCTALLHNPPYWAE